MDLVFFFAYLVMALRRPGKEPAVRMLQPQNGVSACFGGLADNVD